jgi:glucose-6-phosphate dehydrogenase assembly protein OpcA
VLDEAQPEEGWKRAVGLWEESAFSDLRWARLTQWRALTAHFFDIPEVRTASRSFTRLRIAAADRTAAQLFAAWLTSSMPFAPGFRVDIEDAGNTSGGSALQMVHLADGQQGLTIQLETERKCLQTSVSVRGHRSASRVVSMVDQSLTSLMTEELRIRARDLAMERAIASLVGG